MAETEVTEAKSSESESDDDPLKVLIPAMTLLLVTVSPCYFLKEYIECIYVTVQYLHLLNWNKIENNS